MKKLVFLSIFVVFGVSGVSGAEKQGYDLSLSQLLREMNSVGNKEFDTVFQTTEQRANDLETRLTEEKSVLKKDFKKKSHIARKMAKEECERIMDSTEKRIDTYAAETNKQSIAVTKRALQELVDLLTITEQKALEAKKKARQKALEVTVQGLDKGEAFNPKNSKKVSPEVSEEPSPKKIKEVSCDSTKLSGWKKVMFVAFERNLNYLKDIVSCGESPEQAKEILTLFASQRSWFIKKLHKTVDKADKRYCALLEKKRTFAALVRAQKMVQQALEEKISLLKLEKRPAPARLRLIALYEVNALVQEKVHNLAMVEGKIVFTPYEIDDIANGILATLDSTYKPTVRQKTMLQSPKDAVVSERKEIIKKLEVATGQNLELQALIMGHKDQSNSLQREITELKTSLQKSKMEMLTLEQSLSQTKQQLDEVKNDVLREKGLRREAEQRASLVEIMSEQMIADQKRALIKKQQEPVTPEPVTPEVPVAPEAPVSTEPAPPEVPEPEQPQGMPVAPVMPAPAMPTPVAMPMPMVK